MSTRRSIHKKVKWNLENEIARVIEKGVAHGIELKVRKQRIANGREGDVDEEVTKIVETWVTLGFDFNGRENEISQGLGKAVKRRKVRREVSQIRPEVLFVQESKLVVFDNGVIRDIGGDLLSKGVGVDAEGSDITME
ncbi:hypothetical protein LWI28_003456 [Acer negundo]|uniref:Uncharacterized protein n=1 Tax=Acer negundo TaxID=4023 RepID=A0AAD5JS30_ACENE|nr:hypothetical protein LWI28_003456 [Acer negundo]